MKSSSLAITILLASALGACDGGSATPDAGPDAGPPPIDAFTCSGTLTACGMTCFNTQTSDLHCGGCNMPCTGARSCMAGTCECPPSFIPDVLDVGVQEMVSGSFLPGAYVAIYPYIVNEIDIVAIGYDMSGTMLNTPYTLTATIGNPPFVGAGYDVDFQTQDARAAFYATSGTLTFTTACSTGTTGTLTDATFEQVVDLMNPTIDPNGCSFTMASMTFDIGEICPGPPPPA